MENPKPGRYRAPEVDPTGIAIRTGIEVEPGVRFDIVVGHEATDDLSKALAAGIFHDHYRPLYNLLRAVVPQGGRILDLGAHLGTFALSAAAAGYEVVAVEASPRNAAVLQASIDRNGFDRFRLIHAAVSDRPGSLEFCPYGPYGHVANGHTGLPSVQVPCLRVDDLLAELGWDRLDFVKMDIEGSEVAGLAGMSRLLSGPDAPPIFVESNGHTLNFYDQRPDHLKAALEGLGYRNYLVEGTNLYPVAVEDLQPTTVVDYLAVKRPPRGLKTWRIDQGLARATLIDRALASCASANADERAYIARALVRADRAILSEPRIIQAVEALKADSYPTVSTPAASIVTARPSRLRRLVAKVWR